MKAIVQQAAFLELSGDDVVNPDAAVRELESLSETLSGLNPVERQSFIEFVQLYADEEAQNSQPPTRIEFIRSLPEALGLAD